MTDHPHLRASVLSTVLVVATLILLAVLGVMALWDIHTLFFARMNYLQTQRGYLESGFTLYARTENLQDLLNEEHALQLFDSLERSRIYLEESSWGLYQMVSIDNYDKKIRANHLFGASKPWKEESQFYYSGENLSFTASGKTNLKGKLRLPSSGIQYRQIESKPFSGEKVSLHQIATSDKELPLPTSQARKQIEELFQYLNDTTLHALTSDSLFRPFSQDTPIILRIPKGKLLDGTFSGRILLVGDEIQIDSSCRMKELIVVGRKISIREGFRGSVQLFGSDTIQIGKGVTLNYPSGVFLGGSLPNGWVSIAEGSAVNGYVILEGHPDGDKKKIHYQQTITAVVRGLLYVNATAQLQGIVSGPVFLKKTVYKSTFAFYSDLLYNATILDNQAFAYPFWLETSYPRKEAIWLQ